MLHASFKLLAGEQSKRVEIGLQVNFDGLFLLVTQFELVNLF